MDAPDLREGKILSTVPLELRADNPFQKSIENVAYQSERLHRFGLV